MYNNANILAIMVGLKQKTAPQIAKDIAQRLRKIRKSKNMSQQETADKAGISYASYKRFKQKHEISFMSLIEIAIALDSEKDFEGMFLKQV
ncbi:MAG TPA: helix-turn-helix transcriptional regulator [Treponemataceae bacterium]|mgnify:FL=1|nr:helix-turn-helix transcriptional regulator [Treponemataceae bacterium]